jgi:competence CoiA-like predicted nuclease
MGTEKYIFGKAFDYDMGKEDKPKYDLSKSDDSPSLDYENFLDKTKTGKPSFDAYVESLSGEMQIYDGADPYKKDALKGITDKADAFLKRHAGISYEDFLRQSKPETFTENDYENLPERTRYFERDVSTGLAALADIEDEGYDVGEVLRELKGKKRFYERIDSLVNQRPEDYLVQLLEISERLYRAEETPHNLLKELRKLNEKSLRFSKKYSKQRLDIEDRLKLNEEEGRYQGLL